MSPMRPERSGLTSCGSDLRCDDMSSSNALAVASPHQTGEAARAGQYLVFSLQGESYGIHLLGVREIIGYAKPTTVPTMPAFMLGVVNLRDHVVPVIDLSRRLGGDVIQIQKRSAVLILEADGLTLGVVVDAVNAVLDLNVEQIEPVPSFGMGSRREFIQGMAKTDAGLTVLLDVRRIFAVNELAAMTAASGATHE